MNRKIVLALVLGLCLLCSGVSALPVITATISANVSGQNFSQYAVNSVVSQGGPVSVTQTIDLSSVGAGSLFQNAINRVEGAGTGSQIRQGISLSGLAPLQVQNQQNYANVAGDPLTHVTQENRASGGAGGSSLSQFQKNEIFWANGIRGVPFQNNFATGTASFLERIQQNMEFNLA